MTHPEHPVHETHDHTHHRDCEHLSVRHGDHVDYLHGGHLHHPHGDHTDEHVVELAATNPAECTPGHDCPEHTVAHAHSDTCDHEPVPHADHVDYLVDGHLHHPHDDHCDDHGELAVV